MNRLGIHTGADLRRQSASFLQQHFGKYGVWYHAIAHGGDERPVVADRPRKSSGSETTFSEDRLSQSRSRRRASYGFAANRGLDGNAPQKMFVPARPICCAVSRVGTGSTASPLSIACAIR
jgi:hypothetical protein